MEIVEKVIIRVDFYWVWCIYFKIMSKDNKFFIMKLIYGCLFKLNII